VYGTRQIWTRFKSFSSTHFSFFQRLSEDKIPNFKTKTKSHAKEMMSEANVEAALPDILRQTKYI
jgi:hypothetical protein